MAELVDRVSKILDEASKYAGMAEAERFSGSMYADVAFGEMESPIEQALYIALHTVAKTNYLDIAEEADDPGIVIRQQWKIARYRADFFLEYYFSGRQPQDLVRQVVVECDGTAFHERTEAERRYEKQRDRLMQKLGHRVFRFTGKEILDGPFDVAAEIIGYLIGQDVITPANYFPGSGS